MNHRRTLTALGAAALLCAALPVLAAIPAQAEPCGLTPACTAPETRIDLSTGTPVEAGQFHTTTNRTATFALTVSSPADRSGIVYECQLERDGVVLQAFTALDEKSDDCTDGTTGNGRFTPSALLVGGYKLSVRATQTPNGLVALGGSATDATPDVYLWDVEPAPPGPVPGAPDTRLTNKPRFWHTQNWFSVDISADEPVLESECRFDGRRVKDGCTASQFNLFGTGPYDHTLSVRATDREGVQDPAPAVVHFNVPQTAVQIKARKGFRRATGTQGYMLDQYVVATKKGSSITRPFKGVRQLVLVVTKAPRHGAVKVYLGKRLVKTVRLGSSTTRHRVVVVVKRSSTAFSGPLKLVTTSNRRVEIEAVGFSSRRP